MKKYTEFKTSFYSLKAISPARYLIDTNIDTLIITDENDWVNLLFWNTAPLLVANLHRVALDLELFYEWIQGEFSNAFYGVEKLTNLKTIFLFPLVNPYQVSCLRTNLMNGILFLRKINTCRYVLLTRTK